MPDQSHPTRRHVVDTCHFGLAAHLPRADRHEPDEGAEIRLDEGARVVALLGEFHRAGREVEVTRRLGGGSERVVHTATCSRFDDRGRPGDQTRSASAEVWLANAAAGTGTPLKVTVRWTDHGARCWLNVQANPTKLLTGTNAFAARLGAKRHRERLTLLKAPFLVLRRLLRALDRGFDWSDATAERIRAGDVSLHNAQVATYVPLGSPEDLRRFLTWLYAVFCTPVVTKGWDAARLGEYLGLRVDAMLGDDGRPTGVMFRRLQDAAGHAVVTVNFYDKLAAMQDAERALLDAGARAFLGTHLRLDVTLHRPMLERLAAEAGVGRADTVAGWCAAVHAMDVRAKAGEGKGFDEWLRREALGRYLRLPAVMEFRPERLAAAKAKLAGRPHLMAVWDEWTGAAPARGAEDAPALGGWPSLRGLLAARGIPAGTVRSNLSAVRKAGLDPDVPPPFFHRLRMVESLWGLGEAEAAEYFRALEAGDGAALGILLERSLGFADEARAHLAPLAKALLRRSGVPALPPASGGRRARWLDGPAR